MTTVLTCSAHIVEGVSIMTCSGFAMRAYCQRFPLLTVCAWCGKRRYNSNSAHQGEMDDMLAAMEDALAQHGVDAVFAGHVHAYERNFRTFKWVAAACCTPAQSAWTGSTNLGRMRDANTWGQRLAWSACWTKIRLACIGRMRSV